MREGKKGTESEKEIGEDREGGGEDTKIKERMKRGREGEEDGGRAGLSDKRRRLTTYGSLDSGRSWTLFSSAIMGCPWSLNLG